MKQEKSTGRLILRWVLGLLGAACFVWCAIPVFWRVLNIGNALGLLLGLLLLGIALFYTPLRRTWTESVHRKRNRIIRNVVAVLFLLGAAWAAFLTGCMVSSAVARPPEGATVVVLGSQVKGTVPSLDLMGRMEAAAVYLKEHPQAAVVASGGQGSGEDISEAEAIRNGLIALGIEENRIYLEDQSRNTRENLKNTMQVIQENGLSEKLAIVTDDYHEYRAGRIAGRQGITAFAVPAKTPWYIFSSCYFRELLALTKDFIFP